MFDPDVANSNDRQEKPLRRSVWFRPVHQWGRAGLDMLFPPACSLCCAQFSMDGPLPRLCRSCQDQLKINQSERCTRCGHLVTLNTGSKNSCARCWNSRFAFDRVVVLGSYEGCLQHAILRMKHSGEQSLATAVGRLLGSRLAEEDAATQPDIMTYMPMHWRRRLKRGINSAELMAEAAARELAVPYRTLLRMRRQTEKQSMLTPRQRQYNVRGAMAAARRTRLTDQHVAIVDDTLTTGATANEAAKMLRRGGAGEITVVVVGRASSSW